MVKRTSIYLDSEIDAKTLKKINWHFGSFSGFIRKMVAEFKEKHKDSKNVNP